MNKIINLPFLLPHRSSLPNLLGSLELPKAYPRAYLLGDRACTPISKNVQNVNIYKNVSTENLTA